MNIFTKKLKIFALLLGLLCTAALTVACTNTPDTPDTNTTAEVTTPADTPEAETDPETQPETEEETTEAETECQLLFEDNFDGTNLDSTKWNIHDESTRLKKPSRDVSQWDASKVALDGNGNLLLKMEWDADAKKAMSGAVSTKGLFEYGYGYYEASIKFPLTYARTCFFSVTAGDTELDVLKSTSSFETANYEHLLFSGDQSSMAIGALGKNLINIYDGRYHTFGLLRSPEGYTFYIDGKESHFVPAEDIAPTAEAGYLSLYWEAPNEIGAGRNEKKNTTPAEMIVDYVRVYSSLPENPGKAVNTEPELLLTDDFAGTEIDFTKWKYAPEWTRNDYCYWSNEMSVLDGEGHLATKMAWDSERNSLKSGALWSASDYGYGYYEAAIKFPKAYGTWGAFWMMCGDVWKESSADGVEIDIVESINNETGAYNHALHSNYGNLNSLGPTKLYQADIYDGEYHTFGVLRAENGYFFYVDRKLSAIVPHYVYTPCPIPGRMELTVEAAEWAGAGKPECLEQLPSQMLTDYVRVYSAMPDLDSID